jgi:3-dehydroquinate synthase
LTIGVDGKYSIQIGPVDESIVVVEPEPSSVFILTDENVWNNHGKRFTAFDGKLVLPSGETTKSIRRWTECQVWLSQKGADRKSLILAVGGGVIGDLAGFVAATFMRGVRYVNVPTTLLAQIDASIGGKTAVDLPEAKNLVGAFHAPSAVYCDVSFLTTLPRRELVSGMAEAIKYGAILDSGLLEWQESCHEALASVDSEKLEHLVQSCCKIKAAVVKADMLETTGERAKLNFGHTVGHALETALDYKGILHGEAVAVGMITEARIGERMGFTEPGTSGRLQHLLQRWGLPTKLPSRGLSEQVLSVMGKDKKAVRGKIAMTLLKSIGTAELLSDIPPEIIREELTAE